MCRNGVLSELAIEPLHSPYIAVHFCSLTSQPGTESWQGSIYLFKKQNNLHPLLLGQLGFLLWNRDEEDLFLFLPSSGNRQPQLNTGWLALPAGFALGPCLPSQKETLRHHSSHCVSSLSLSLTHCLFCWVDRVFTFLPATSLLFKTSQMLSRMGFQPRRVFLFV